MTRTDPKFSIERPSISKVVAFESRYALQQDNWNDYGFNTLYHLYVRTGRRSDEVTYVGGVRILKKGQTTTDHILIQKPFSTLSDEWVSVGASLDYYQRLNELPKQRRAHILNALNDAAAHPSAVDIFGQEEGWEVSLFRDNPNWQEFLADASAILQGSFSSLAGVEASFTYKPAGLEKPISLDFKAPDPDDYLGNYRRIGPSRSKVLLPDRIYALIGRNGCGKSTILARLARVAFASPEQRATSELARLGLLEPRSLGFTRVITISYSAFDSFVVPGQDQKNIDQLAQDIESGEGRFVFCGLRDLVAEARADLDKLREDEASAENTRIADSDRKSSTRLKPVETLAREFHALIKRIHAEDRLEFFESALEPLLREPSLKEIEEPVLRLVKTSRFARTDFISWSTGHKIVLHVIASLVVHSRPRSLVLYDEPETHLHPPLMAALIHAIRLILTESKALCLMATHSPVLIQETLAKHVLVVRRTGDQIEINRPRLETFGENVGMLTYDIFGMTSSQSDFHEILDLLVGGYDSIDELESVFEPGLSAQARAYVAAKIAERN